MKLFLRSFRRLKRKANITKAAKLIAADNRYTFARFLTDS